LRRSLPPPGSASVTGSHMLNLFQIGEQVFLRTGTGTEATSNGRTVRLGVWVSGRPDCGRSFTQAHRDCGFVPTKSTLRRCLACRKGPVSGFAIPVTATRNFLHPRPRNPCRYRGGPAWRQERAHCATPGHTTSQTSRAIRPAKRHGQAQGDVYRQVTPTPDDGTRRRKSLGTSCRTAPSRKIGCRYGLPARRAGGYTVDRLTKPSRLSGRLAPSCVGRRRTRRTARRSDLRPASRLPSF